MGKYRKKLESRNMGSKEERLMCTKGGREKMTVL